jgi:hypothetical protein
MQALDEKHLLEGSVTPLAVKWADPELLLLPLLLKPLTQLLLLLLNLYTLQAMQALDEKHLLEGSVTPLAVKWADPELQIKKRRAVEDSNADNRMLFFAKVLRSANEDEVKALFERYGRVVEVNLFRAFQVCWHFLLLLISFVISTQI